MMTTGARARAVLAVDLGGTNLRAAVVGPDEEPDTVHAAVVGEAPADRDAFTARIRALVDDGVPPPAAVGLAVPGTADGSRCRWVPKLPYLDGLDLHDQLQLPVTVANDAQLALLAEASVGAASGRRDVVLFAIGTGIGSAVMAGGRIVTGHAGAACSAGWLTLEPSETGDPRHGWLERHAAGPSFDAAARGLGLADGAALLDRAARGDRPARDAVREPALALGAAIAATVALLDPELVLLAGGVAASFGAIAEQVHEILRRHTPPHLHGVPIEVGRFGPRAGLIGAAIAGRLGPSWIEVRP